MSKVNNKNNIVNNIITVSGPILDSRGMSAFFWGTFSEKEVFCLLLPPKQMSFLTISHENNFLKS